MVLMFNIVKEDYAMQLKHQNYVFIVFKKREMPVGNFRKFVIQIKIKLNLELNKHIKRTFFSGLFKYMMEFLGKSTSRVTKSINHELTVALCHTPHKGCH